MVLSGNETPTGFEVHARVVDGSMTKFQLVGFRSGGQPEDLGPQAYSHYWKLGLHQISRGFYRSAVDLGVSRSIADDHSPGVQFEDLVDRTIVRHPDNSRSLGEKATKDPVLDTTVHDNDS